VILLEDLLICPIKINLTLRVLSQRPNGYHEIISLFWKKKGVEGLTIQPNGNENIGDILETEGLKIDGENILTKTLLWARAKCQDIPSLRIRLKKEFPTGSGIGAGSGNSAEMLRWLSFKYGLEIINDSVSMIGADVPFLAGDTDVALISGIGEKVAPLGRLSDLKVFLVFPGWKTDTAAAYMDLDNLRKHKKNKCCHEGYEREALTIFDKLKSKEKTGLLPNDFLEVISKEHPEYFTAFDIAEKSGSLAWGLSGSGSALFMIFKDTDSLKTAKQFLEREKWITKTTELE
jgi:4-diphosphocytidyl-2-C-methyl-D-erythritol kinase